MPKDNVFVDMCVMLIICCIHVYDWLYVCLRCGYELGNPSDRMHLVRQYHPVKKVICVESVSLNTRSRSPHRHLSALQRTCSSFLPCYQLNVFHEDFFVIRCTCLPFIAVNGRGRRRRCTAMDGTVRQWTAQSMAIVGNGQQRTAMACH